MKKILALVLALVMALSACSLATADEAKFGDGVTLNVMICDDGSGYTDINTNEFTLYLEKNTGVKVNYQVTQREVFAEKMNLVMGTGNYPDIIIYNEIDRAFMKMYGEEDGILVALNDFIENKSVYYKAVTERYPTLVTDMALSDGNIYGFTGIQETFHGMEQSGKMHVNMKWLKNLNLEVPTTIDEFADMLRAFRDEDANGNGDPNDEIPLGGCLKTWNGDPYLILMNSFCALTGDLNMVYYNDDDHTIMPTWEQEHFKDGLIYINGLYEEGLIDPAAFTQDVTALDALKAEKVCRLGAYQFGHMGTEFYETQGADAFEMILPLEGPYGRQGVVWYDGIKATDASIVVTDNCQNLDVALQWCDYLFADETSWDQMWGPKDEAWRYAEEGEGLDIMGRPAEFVALDGWRDISGQKKWGLQRVGQHDFETRMVVSEDLYDINNYNTRLARQSASLEPYAIDTNIDLPILDEYLDEYTQLKTQLNDYFRQAVVEFIVGRRDVEKDWDAFLADMDKLQYARFYEIYEESFKASSYAPAA